MPTDSIACLVQALSSLDVRRWMVGRGEILEPASRGGGCVLLSGQMSQRRRDNHKNILTYSAPFVFGLDTLFSHSDWYTLHTGSACEFFWFNRQTAVQAFDAANCWHAVVTVLEHECAGLVARELHLTSEGSYPLVKHALETLWAMPEQERADVSVFNYILSRGYLSRSSLIAMLRRLETAGYIVTCRGQLMALSSLPASSGAVSVP